MSRKLKDFCKPVLGSLAVGAVVAGCAGAPNRAPIEDRDTRGGAPRSESPPSAAAAPDAPKLLPGWENAGKPGYYTVKPGDTLIRIGLENGQPWRDIVKWSALENPNAIEVGQVLRVVPPASDPNQVSSRPVASSRIESRPLESKPAPAPPPVPSTAAAAASSAPVAAPKPMAPLTPPPPAFPPPAPPVPPPREGDDGSITWGWPSSDPVVAPFDDGKNKGLVFGGKAGDPVFAAAEGRVVYAGSGLRGYGNLIILKHNNTYLTAYAHNQTLLVKEDQTVRKGQKIAEMGATDADGVKLHFEIRKLGKPIDPARLLPPR